MIVAEAVAMVDLDGEGSTPPLRQPAFLAAVFEQAGPEQGALDRQPAFRLR